MECYNLLASLNNNNNNNSVNDDEDDMMMMTMMMTKYLNQPYWALGTYSERAIL
jgi:hypothetical protein